MSGVLSVWSKATRPGSRAEPTVALPSEYAAFINQTLSSCSAVGFVHIGGNISACTWPHTWGHFSSWSDIRNAFCKLSMFSLKAYSSSNIGQKSMEQQQKNTFSITGIQRAFWPYLLVLWTRRLLDVIEEKEQHWENTCLYRLNLLSLTDMQLVRHAVIL